MDEHELGIVAIGRDIDALHDDDNPFAVRSELRLAKLDDPVEIVEPQPLRRKRGPTERKRYSEDDRSAGKTLHGESSSRHGLNATSPNLPCLPPKMKGRPQSPRPWAGDRSAGYYANAHRSPLKAPGLGPGIVRLVATRMRHFLQSPRPS